MAERQFSWDGGAAQANFEQLGENPYPGRLIVLGLSPSSEEVVQVYAVMGRSPNSRNRVLEMDGDTVKTDAFDASQVTDPSLIIYNAMKPRRESTDSSWGNLARHVHIVSNGHQTDWVASRLHPDFIDPVGSSAESLKSAFGHALMMNTFRERDNVTSFEPDRPNFTPRITGYMGVGAMEGYGWGITRRDELTGQPHHSFGGGYLEDLALGQGLAFHTYNEDDPEVLPSFEGNPYPVPIQGTVAETAEAYWDGALDKDNRVALAVKFINRTTGMVEIEIINQLQPKLSGESEKRDLLSDAMFDSIASAPEAPEMDKQRYIKLAGWDTRPLDELEQVYLQSFHGNRKLPYATA